MKMNNSLAAPLGLVLLIVLSLAGQAHGFVQALCSNQNTGANGDSHSYQYQSNGACVNSCQGYSFGIVQYDKCWCSNIAPSDTTDLSACSEQCPGYPMDLCGNSDNGLFGYIALGKAPQGTADGGSKKPSPSSQDPTSQAPTSQAPSPTPSSPSPSTSTRPSTTTMRTTPTPSPSVLTVSGSVQTVVISPTIDGPQATTTVAVPDQQPAVSPASSGFFTNKGAVAGVFTVVGLAVAAIIAGLIFFFWRRHRRDAEGSERLNSMEEDRASVVPSTFMSRRTSELGLRTDVPRVGTSDEKTPTSMHMPGNGTASRRTSMPLTDQRLNPANLFHDNGSHLSVASLQDNQDYSRPVLQVANPDRPGSSAIEDD